MAEEQFFYRFRTLKNIFEYKELENLEIYFATPEELNDPMEAYKEIIFQGDIVIWRNLFRHYIACFLDEYMRFHFNQEQKMNDIDAEYKIDYLTYGLFSGSKYMQNTFNKISNEFLEYYDEEIKILSEKNRVCKQELIYYLHFFNELIVSMINIECFISLKEEIDYYYTLKMSIKNRFKHMIKNVLNIDFFDVKRKDMLSYYNEYINMENLYYIKFTEEYVNGLIKHFYPYEYIASFSDNYDDHTIWSHYTDNQKGICLIYKNDINFILDEKNYLLFSNKLHKVRYSNQLMKTNFFKDTYIFEYKEYMNFWKLDTKNNMKSISYKKKKLSYFNHNIEYATIFQKYTKKSIDFLTRKLKNWTYENEYRLILLSYWINLQKQDKLIKYDFNSLDGIIFGIRTPITDKLKIIDIIQKLCKQHNRNHFNFYQAYTDKNGKICKEKLYIHIDNNERDNTNDNFGVI